MNTRRGVGALAAAVLSALQARVAAAQSGGVGTLAGRTFGLELQAVKSAAGADLFLTVYALNAGTSAPAALKQVQVQTYGTDGRLRGTKNYSDVPAPGGTAVIALPPQTQLGELIDVQVVVQTAQSTDAEVLRGAAAVAELAVNPRQVVTQNFLGYGAQFNMHLYTALNDPARGFTGNEPPKEVETLEAKVLALKPGHVRIFLSSANYLPENQNRMDSFYKTVALAHRAGATVNVTWWFLTQVSPGYGKPGYDKNKQLASIDGEMTKFANTLYDLVANKGYGAVQHITIQNEPSPITWLNQQKDVYEHAYRALDANLRALGIRSRIKFTGGDLVFNNQESWFTYMADNMGDILDSWSCHIYWNYWDTARMLQRLTEVRAIWDGIAPEKRKPLFITEFGVRGQRHNPELNGPWIQVPNPYRKGALTNIDPGLHNFGPVGIFTYDPNLDQHTIPISEANIAAFEQGWFDLLAANLGYVTTVKWDAYRAQYDFGYQDHSLIGYRFTPTAGEDRWPLRPAYHMQRLMATTTGAGWRVLGYRGASGAKLLTPFRGPAGETTVFALNTDGAATSFSIGGLPPNATLRLLVWNGDGSGSVVDRGTLSSGRGGAVTVAAQAQSLVALTTVTA